MRVLAKFWGLPRKEKLLLAEATVFVAVSRAALWMRPKERAWMPLTFPMWTADGVTADRIAWAVAVTAARIPAASCLTQALAGREMLRRRGLESEIRVGVTLAGGFRAHAWLIREGQVLLGGAQTGEYAELGRLPCR
jgi:hypothetical protein